MGMWADWCPGRGEGAGEGQTASVSRGGGGGETPGAGRGRPGLLAQRRRWPLLMSDRGGVNRGAAPRHEVRGRCCSRNVGGRAVWSETKALVSPECSGEAAPIGETVNN